jgi:hypothetical protein
VKMHSLFSSETRMHFARDFGQKSLD